MLEVWLRRAFIGLVIAANGPALAIDWAKVPGKDMVLFYPAQMSWELLLTQSDHSGANPFRQGKNCQACHGGEERSSGNLMVKDKRAEPDPIAGKPGFIVAKVKFAHDAERFYVNIAITPGDQPDAGMDPDFLTKIGFMFDDGSVPEMTRGGCFAACHDDLARMPSGGKSDRTKYLTASRSAMTRQGGDDHIKSDAELDALRVSGVFLEYWQAKLNKGAEPTPAQGIVLAARNPIKEPEVTATGGFENGQWIVTLARKMNPGAPYKPIAAGKTYTFGISVHAGHTAKRFHYVSLENTMVLDSGKADFVAAAQ
jgi:hypothetical protein